MFGHHHHRRDRADVFVAGTHNPYASSLYEYWHELRATSLPRLATLTATAILASASDSDRNDVAEEYAQLLGRRGASGKRMPQELAERGISIPDLARYWHIAACAEPPVWAHMNARMPDLSCVRHDLPFDVTFQALSATSQLLLLTFSSYPHLDGIVVDWQALGTCINVPGTDALEGIKELASRGWVTRVRLHSEEREPSVVQFAKARLLIRSVGHGG